MGPSCERAIGDSNCWLERMRRYSGFLSSCSIVHFLPASNGVRATFGVIPTWTAGSVYTSTPLWDICPQQLVKSKRGEFSLLVVLDAQQVLVGLLGGEGDRLLDSGIVRLGRGSEPGP